MISYQKEIQLKKKERGFHLVTEEVMSHMPEIKNIEIGILHIFIKHTSAGIAINENADPTVREDFESHFNEMVPENQPYYKHTQEGPDDMPAHIKGVLTGFSLHIPISKGKLNLGTWQGIYLCEFRDHGGPRKLVLTAMGTGAT